MESAIDVLAGRRVPASHGRQGRTYECARCRAQVHLRAGQYRAAHFAHNPGVGDPECELFADSVSTNSPQPAYEIRTSPLQLCIAEDGSWQLYVEIPPIEPGEWGLAQLSRFAGSFVTIDGDAGSTSATRSARELWPGSGRNAVAVVPTTARSSFRTNSAWPDRVERRRWHRELPPVSAGGTLFARYRGGNFRKYDPQTTPLHWGDTVILVSAGSKKFVSGPRIRRLETRHTEAADWFAWEGSLPARQNARVRDWLAGLGASVEARNARPKLVSVPTGYAADDVPRYPAGAVVAVDAGASWCEIHLHHRNRPYTAEQLGGPGMTGLRSDRLRDGQSGLWAARRVSGGRRKPSDCTRLVSPVRGVQCVSLRVSVDGDGTAGSRIRYRAQRRRAILRYRAGQWSRSSAGHECRACGCTDVDPRANVASTAHQN